jgi:erythromycin esterase-like protein
MVKNNIPLTCEPQNFYRIRSEVTKLLVQERGFNAVCLEADFPDAFRVNMYARGFNKDKDPQQALSDFKVTE